MKHHELRQWPARSLGSSACVWSLGIAASLKGWKSFEIPDFFYVKKSYFPHLEMKTMLHNRNLENKPDSALTQIFFCFCFIFPWFPRRGVAEPWGGPDRRELLGELVRCSEVDVPMCCYLHIRTTFLPTFLVDFWRNIFSSSQGVLREKNTMDSMIQSKFFTFRATTFGCCWWQHAVTIHHRSVTQVDSLCSCFEAASPRSPRGSPTRQAVTERWLSGILAFERLRC